MTARATALFCVLVAAVNGAHPLFHAFEDGALDSVLGYLNALAAQFAQAGTAKGT